MAQAADSNNGNRASRGNLSSLDSLVDANTSAHEASSLREVDCIWQLYGETRIAERQTCQEPWCLGAEIDALTRPCTPPKLRL